MRSVPGMLGIAVLAGLASTAPAATLALTDSIGDPASVTVVPGGSFSIKAVLTLGTGEGASGIGFNLNSSQSDIFTITARSQDQNNPFTDPQSSDTYLFDNTQPGYTDARVKLNPTNAVDLGGTTDTALDCLPGTYGLYTFTLATNAAAPNGTYQITIVEGYYTNQNFDSFDVASTIYSVTLVPEPISLGMTGVVLGGLVLRPRRRVVEE